MADGKRVRTRRWIWGTVGLAALIALGVGLYLFARPQEPTVQVVTIVRATMKNKIFASGLVRPASRQFVMPNQLPVPVARFDVQVGDKVTVGQVLITGDNQAQAAAVAAAKVALQNAQQALDTASSPLSGPAGFTAPPATSTVLAAKAQVSAAQAQLTSAEVTYNSTVIRAELNGTVILENKNGMASDLSPAPYVEVVSNQKKLVVNVSEVDAVQIHTGLTATATSEAYPNKSWTATVMSVQGFAVTSSTGSGQVEVDLTVPGDFPVPLGYQVDLNIISSTHNEVPVVPYQALVQDGNSYATFVFANGQVHKVPVTLGITSNSEVEVTKGLTPGTKVVQNPPASLQDGQAVKVSD